MTNKIAPSKKTNSSELSKSRFSKFGFIAFGIVFAAIGSYVLFRSFAAPAPPTVYTTTPAASYMAINTSFSVQVRENSSTTSVNSVLANLSYPSSLLSLVSIDTTGTAFTTEAQNTGGSGSITLARGTCGGCAALTGDQLVATLNFKTLTTGGAAAVSFVNNTYLISSSTNQDILGGLAATAGFTVNVDTTAPAVSVTSPANNATLAAGSTQSLTFSATDADRVTGVDVYIDGAKVTTLASSPYTYSWDTTGLAFGTHTIVAKASDPSGNQGTSSTVTVTLADLTPPTVSVSAPSAGAALRGSSVAVSATAADNTGGTGLLKVEFYVDGVLKSTDTTSPYGFTWDTTTATNASHSLTAKAYDNASPANTTTSSAVSVTVDNSAPTAPTSLHASATALTSITLAWTASTDNAGVTGYRITRNGTTITTTNGTTTSYNDSGLTSGTSYTYTVTALDAAGNTSTAATLTTSTSTPKAGDVNGDGQVTITDLSILLSAWGSTTNALADLNHNGSVDIFDLSILLSNYGS